MSAIDKSTCRSCGATLHHVFVDLGAMPPANSYLPSVNDIPREQAYRLRTLVCENCFLVQVDCDVAPEVLFADYAYFSSYSNSWLSHARDFCTMAVERFGLGSGSFVVEIASNDGYLLKNLVAAGIPVLGIDPSETVARAAIASGVPTEVLFFGRAVAEDVAARYRRADLIVANNVLAHVPDLNDFVAGIAALLAPYGTASFEFPHLLRLIEKIEFDTIYHEHFSYFSLEAVERCFARHGLQVVDVEELPTHGGSLRVFTKHAGASAADGPGLTKVRADEAAAGLDRLEAYNRFADRVAACRHAFQAFLAEAGREGKRVAGYGAAAKGNTLLNSCGVTADDILFVADRNPHKQGKLLPGSHIPVCAPERIAEARPDYIVILPWNLEAEIKAQLAFVRDWGGRFVVPVPAVRID